MSERGQCSVRFTRRYEASRREVWRALTEAASLARWLGRPREVELAPGGSLTVELPEGGVVDARVREIDPGRVLELDWRRPGEDVSLVRFELREEGGGTVLVLDHSRIDERYGMASIARWERALRRLERTVGS
jgi:uncharacterized protein YndB with AHSA1/START domain